MILRKLVASIAFAAIAACGATVSTDVVPQPRDSPLRGEALASALQEEIDILAAAGTAKQEAAEGLPSDATVDEYYAAAGRVAISYGEALDEAEDSAERLQALVDDAVEGGHLSDLGVDQTLLYEIVEEFSLWIEAEKLQNDPDICREHIPSDRGSMLFTDAVGPDYVSCLTEFLSNPIIERGSFRAAERLQELGQELATSW